MPNASGRATISLERVVELDGDTLIMPQTSTDNAETDEEQLNFGEVTSSPLWNASPAVSQIESSFSSASGSLVMSVVAINFWNAIEKSSADICYISVLLRRLRYRV